MLVEGSSSIVDACACTPLSVLPIRQRACDRQASSQLPSREGARCYPADSAFRGGSALESAAASVVRTAQCAPRVQMTSTARCTLHTILIKYTVICSRDRQSSQWCGALRTAHMHSSSGVTGRSYPLPR